MEAPIGATTAAAAGVLPTMGAGAGGAAVGIVSVLADTAGTPATALSVGTAGFIPGDFVAGVMTPLARAGFSGAGVALTGGALLGAEATFVAGATTAAAGTGISGSGAALTGGVLAGGGATTAVAACGTAEGPPDILKATPATTASNPATANASIGVFARLGGTCTLTRCSAAASAVGSATTRDWGAPGSAAVGVGSGSIRAVLAFSEAGVDGICWVASSCTPATVSWARAGLVPECSPRLRSPSFFTR
ncbi:MAG: hypothetical protein LH632_23835, partial [Rhodoferax sp.]|nr:hypothetical protein [Rhodoferax sp.]